MIWTGFPIFWVALITAAAVALLVAFQFLMQQSHKRRIVTVLFWPDCTPFSPARVLWNRFLRIGSFLLLLLILLLVCFSLAGMERARIGSPVVIVADADSRQSSPDELRSQINYLADQVKHDQNLTVILADPEPRVLLSASEPRQLLNDRLRHLQTVDAPVNSLRALGMAYQLVRWNAQGEIWFVSRDASMFEDCGRDAAGRIRLAPAGGDTVKPALLSMVFVLDEQDINHGRIYMRLSSSAGDSAKIRIELLHSTKRLSIERVNANVRHGPEFVSPVLVADGSDITIAIVDEKSHRIIVPIAWRLPRIAAIAVQMDPRVPYALQAAVRACGAEQRSDRPDVIVTNDNGPTLSALPAIVVVKKDNPHSVEGGVIKPAERAHPLVAGLDFESARLDVVTDVKDLGVPLLRAGDSVVAALDQSGTHPRLYLSSELLATDSDVIRRIAFVTLIHRALLTFSGSSRDVAAVPASLYFQDPARFEQMPSAALLLPSSLPPPPEVSQNDRARRFSGWPTELWFWSLAAALIVMMIETILYWRGRIV